jgi:hypothetical protein
MEQMVLGHIPDSPYIQLLRNKIDITQTPFSARGSRLLLYRYPKQDALYLKFAERLTKIAPGLEAHRLHPPFLQDLVLINERGEPLSFNIVSYPHALFLETSLGIFKIAFHEHDSLVIGLPPASGAGVRLTVNSMYTSLKTLQVRTNSEFIKQERTPVEDGTRLECIIIGGDDVALTLTCERQGGNYGPACAFSEVLALAERRWHEWFSQAPAMGGPYRDQYYYAWWVLANNLVAPFGQLRYEGLVPSKKQYIGVWNWDAGFHAIALRYIEPGLARDQLRILLENQLDDGMLPDVVHDEGIVASIDHPIAGMVTKPPILAWTALKIHALDQELEFLREIYPRLKRWNRWWLTSRASELDGLVQYQHPYSSGLDDSPLWDQGTPVVSPDLNTYLSIQMDSLAIIAYLIGLTEEALTWRQRADAITQSMIEQLYDPHIGIFQALYQGEVIQAFTPFNLYPLWTGRMNTEIETRLVKHLTNPETFWSPYPLRTVAGNSTSYSASTMWRGPVWININYIFIEALQRVRRMALAEELRSHTLDLIARNEGIYEFYDPERGTPPTRAVPMFGWSAALFVDLCLQPGAQTHRPGDTTP